MKMEREKLQFLSRWITWNIVDWEWNRHGKEIDVEDEAEKKMKFIEKKSKWREKKKKIQFFWIDIKENEVTKSHFFTLHICLGLNHHLYHLEACSSVLMKMLKLAESLHFTFLKCIISPRIETNFPIIWKKRKMKHSSLLPASWHWCQRR